MSARGLCFGILLVAVPALVHGRACPDGDHPPIDVRAISLKYETSALETTVSGLGVFGAQISISPKTLQKAAVATQKMNEFVKALVVGFNSCAITRHQYQEALEKLLPGLRDDGEILEGFRQQMILDRRVDRERFNVVLARYERQLRQFATLSGRELDYERIEAIVEERVRAHVATEMARAGKAQADVNQVILRRLAELERRLSGVSLATPEQVDVKFAAGSAQVKSASEPAEAAYREGYRLFQRYRFAESIPHLERAVATVPLPEFYLALARAYEEAQEPEKAKRTYREGITVAHERKETSTEARMVASLMLLSMRFSSDSVRDRSEVGRLYARLDARAFPKALEVALAQGDIKNAMTVTALMLPTVGFAESYDILIDQRDELAARLGEEHPQVALYDTIRIVLLLAATERAALARGRRITSNDRVIKDRSQIGELAQRVLAVNEVAYGPVHLRVAVAYDVLGQVMASRKDYDAALQYVRKSLSIHEQIWGPSHELVAGEHMNLARVYEFRGDRKSALKHLEIARAWFAGLPAGAKSVEVQAIDMQIAKLRADRRDLTAGEAPPARERGSGEAVHAFHILVQSKETAARIIKELASSSNLEKDFRAYASEHSTDPSARSNGGDLSWFRRNQMVKPFEEAAFAMRPGELSRAPVHTQFGWHVIYVKERK